jgi:hypothetical protein
MTLSYVKHEKIWLKDHPQFRETWLRDRIVEDPAILGLGDLDVKDAERTQPSGGRLDLLLADPESGKRYEVELMLGPVNENHIVRCIEYWDVERKRYPRYDHTAILVAESITSRFLNVIGLFNQTIPLIAIQLDALKIGDQIVLNFVKVLDKMEPGLEDEDEVPGEVTDRSFWESKGSRESVAVADACAGIIKEFDPSLNLKFNKYYIGLANSYGPNNFVLFKAKKKVLRVEAKTEDQETWSPKIEDAGLVILPGEGKRDRLIFRLTMPEFEKNRPLLKELFEACYKEQGE